MPHPLRALGLAILASPLGSPALAASHTFVLTYRNFGPVEVDSTFTPGAGYDVRPEGCYAKHSDEAICGFTLRARRALAVTNLGNAAHSSGADGSAIRTCCMFVQGDDQGYPITKASDGSAGVGVLDRPLSPGQQLGLMLRVPNYRKASPLVTITFSRGHGDPGIALPQHVVELP